MKKRGTSSFKASNNNIFSDKTNNSTRNSSNNLDNNNNNNKTKSKLTSYESGKKNEFKVTRYI